MKSIFIGTVELSWHSLNVINKYLNVEAIFTFDQKFKKNISNFKSLDDISLSNNIPIYFIKNINSKRNIDLIKRIKPDLIFCIGWPQIIKNQILQIPKYESIGIHTSLLPKYRGGAPINWAIINNEKKWGISLMYLGNKADNGDIIDQLSFNIEFNDTVKEVYDKATEASIKILNKNLPDIIRKKNKRKKQNTKLSSYFNKRKPSDGQIIWKKTSLEIYNWIRALTHPYPGSFTFINKNEKIIIWDAKIYNKSSIKYKPGQLIKIIPYKGFLVQCGTGVILIKKNSVYK